MIGPREDFLSWEDTFMLLALTIAQRSKDPNTQVGACLVNVENKVIGLGYNGPPKGICPSTIPWEREGAPEDTKYPYIVHAEANALDNCTTSTKGSTLYVSLHPCHECSKNIIQAGIKRVIYLNNPYKDMWQTKVSEKMLRSVDIELKQHKWNSKELTGFLKSLIDSTLIIEGI